MAESEYQDYLAARVLSESKPVTYRLLARALNVNVNTAKRMLFDFHQKQNSKKPKSVHATYIVSGTKRIAGHNEAGAGQDGADAVMQSSPFMASMPEQTEGEEEPVKKTAITITREEELEATRAQFETETSIHIYSLEPGPIESLSVLSNCNHEISSQHGDEDPLERWRTYGSIQNPYIKRRTTKYAPPAATAKVQPAAPKPAAKHTPITQPKKENSLPSRKESASETSTSGQSASQSAPTVGALKRSDSKPGAAKKDKTAGDIFKSFAKAKAKPKEDKSKESTPAPVEDEPMQGMSEDEGDPDDEPEVAFNEEAAEVAKKAREERAEKLRKMMEEPDEEMTDAPAAEEAQTEASQPEKPDVPEPDDNKPTVTVSNGRRRGKRRVMKKKKVKDEDGYLVTREEAVWESFSEDEPETKKLKPAPAKPAATAKGKAAGKKGQGSIASFFKKA